MYDSAHHTAPLLPSGVKSQHVSDPLIKVRLHEELIMRRERSWQWPQSSEARLKTVPWKRSTVTLVWLSVDTLWKTRVSPCSYHVV